MKPVVFRPLAEADLIDVTSWYGEQGGESLAGRFFDAARESAVTIGRMPGIGSPRIGLLAGIEGLRSWPVDHFPVRWCYFDRPDFVDVVRLLGERQDIAAIFGGGID